MKKIKNKNFIIDLTVIFVVIILILFSFYRLAKALMYNSHLPRTINVKVIEKVDYNKEDFVFIKEKKYSMEADYNNEVSFWLTTINGDKELFRVQYSGLIENIKYRKYDNYIYFWLNGNEYKMEETNYDKPDKELRMITDANLYRYDIKSSIVDKIDIGDPEKTIIIDVLRVNDEEVIIKEVADKQKSFGMWDGIHTFVGNSKYDFSITDYYLFGSRSIFINDKVIIPTNDSVVVIFNDNIEKKYIYPKRYPFNVKLYNFKEGIIGIVDRTMFKYDSNLEVVGKIELSEYEYLKIEVLDNNAILYGINNNNIFIDYIDFDTLQLHTLDSVKLVNNERIENILFKYDYYKNSFVIYEKVSDKILAKTFYEN